jgi:hypothetical protein
MMQFGNKKIDYILQSIKTMLFWYSNRVGNGKNQIFIDYRLTMILEIKFISIFEFLNIQ